MEHQILSMEALTTTLDRFDYAYNALRNSLWIEIFTDHKPCWMLD